MVFSLTPPPRNCKFSLTLNEPEQNPNAHDYLVKGEYYQAEGLHSIYYAPAAWDTFLQEEHRIEPPMVEYEVEDVPEPTYLTVPVGKLIYELAVQFQTIGIEGGEHRIEPGCDFIGESLSHWVNRGLWIEKWDLGKLVSNYDKGSRYSLERVYKVWADLNKDLMGSPW